MTIKCCIVEEDLSIVRLLESYIKKTPFLDMGKKILPVTSGNILKTLITEPPDLVFISLKFLAEIKDYALNEKSIIIFIKKAPELFLLDDVNLTAPNISYLSIPVTYSAFLMVLNRLIEDCNEINPDIP